MDAFVITHAVIFTVDSRNWVIPDGYLHVDKGRIMSLGSMEGLKLPDDLPRIDFSGDALLPGLIDCHSHSSLMRGVTENLALMEWLPLYQREFRAMTAEDAKCAAQLVYLEALKSGTTCIMDMYRFMDQCGDAALELGIRANLAPYVADMPGKDFFSTVAENEALIESHHDAGGGRLKVWMGLEHLFYCSSGAYHNAVARAREYGIGIHTHACEQSAEEQAVTEHFGKRSIAQLEEYGILGESTLLAHCVWLNDDEIKLLADTGTAVAHCPVSNAKLASGIARTPEMLEAGLRVGLGSDGNVCNNSLDLFEEMKFGSLIQKANRLDPTSMPAQTLLRMATIEGARALNLDREIGSLEVGKRADMIRVGLNTPNLAPILLDASGGNLLWNLVFSARGSDVHSAWVDGEQLMENRRVTRIDEQKWLQQAQAGAQKLYERASQLDAPASMTN
jgi:5-methylthioadenosine/S-adenosylhomocysteine deaminase